MTIPVKENEQVIYTQIVHDDNCCGCINITVENYYVVMVCNKCGKEVGRAEI